MMDVPWSGLPVIDLFDARFETDPYQLLAEVREQCPLAVSQSGLEVLDYHSCHTLARDRRLVTDHMGLVRALELDDQEVIDFKARTVVSMHGRQHARLRAPLAQLLSRPRASAMRGLVRRLVRETLASLEGVDAEIELFSRICQVIPALLYCEWTSSPHTDALLVGKMSREVLEVFYENRAYNESVTYSYHEMFDYVSRQLSNHRLKGISGDLLSDLIRTCDQSELSPIELQDMACVLLESSIENTVHQIALVLRCLLETPHVWQELATNHHLVPMAVREAIRLESRTRSIDRLTVEPFELHGINIPAGAKISLRVMAGQRDAEAYPCPDEFQLDRLAVRPSLAFSGGPTSCPGRHLAIIEIEEVVYGLLESFECLALTRPVEADSSAFLYNITEVPASLYNGRYA